MNRRAFSKYLKTVGFEYDNKNKCYVNGEYIIVVCKLQMFGVTDIVMRKNGECVHDGNSFLDMYGFIEYNKLFR